MHGVAKFEVAREEKRSIANSEKKLLSDSRRLRDRKGILDRKFCKVFGKKLAFNSIGRIFLKVENTGRFQ